MEKNFCGKISMKKTFEKKNFETNFMKKKFSLAFINTPFLSDRIPSICI